MLPGNGADGDGVNGDLNDLWRWDGSEWTWMGGSSKVSSNSNFGTIGVASLSNQPGSRYASAFGSVSNSLVMYGGQSHQG